MSASSPFAPLLDAIRPLRLAADDATHASSSDSSAGDAATSSYRFAFVKHHPPALPFDTRTALLTHLHACNAQVADWFDEPINRALSADDKQLLLHFGTSSLLQHVWADADVPAWLSLLKVLARTRSQLDATLYAPDFILCLLDNIDKHATGAEAEHVAILSQSLRLLLNLCVVNRNLVHRALRINPEDSDASSGGSSALVPRTHPPVRSTTTDALDPSRPEPLAALVGALSRMRNTDAEPDALWLLVRVLLFVLVREELAERAVVRADVYATLLRLLLWATQPDRLDLPLRDRDAANASSSSSSSSPLALGDHGRSDSPAQPKLALELLKVLTNLSLEASDSGRVPTMRAALVESGTESSRAEGTRLYDAYLARLTAILACGVEIPDECKEGYAGDPRAKAAAGALMPTATSSDAASSGASSEASTVEQAAVALDDVHIDQTEQRSGSTSASSSSSSQPPAAASSGSSSSGSYTPFDRQQTQIILAKMAAEASTDQSSTTPSNRADALLQLQKDAANVLMGPEGRSALPLLEQDGCAAFHGMMQILHRQLLEGKQEGKKREAELLLQPILSSLTNLVQESAVLRAHAKRCIFLDLSVAPPLPAGVKKTDASNYGMAPAGAVSERIVDPDPRSLKSLLMPLVTTLNFNLKNTVSELLWKLCDQDTSEYIRLLGFGAAVGLLAEKGLPGFGMLKQQAVNIDDVMRKGGKL